MPPRNPLPYVLGYAASGALVAGCIYYNRATLVPRARAAAGWLREVCTDFTKIHVVEPVKNIYTELVYRYLSLCLPFSLCFCLSLSLSLTLVCSVDLPCIAMYAVSILYSGRQRPSRTNSRTHGFSLQRSWRSGKTRRGLPWVVTVIISTTRVQKRPKWARVIILHIVYIAIA